MSVIPQEPQVPARSWYPLLLPHFLRHGTEIVDLPPPEVSFRNVGTAFTGLHFASVDTG